MSPLDPIDQKILAILQTSARVPLREVAKQVGRSRSAVQSRIERLEREGVITGYRAAVAGYDQLSHVIEIYLHQRLSPDNVIALLRGVPEVVGCFRISGDADLMVMISSTSLKRLQEICEPIWQSADVKTTKTTMVLKSYLGPA